MTQELKPCPFCGGKAKVSSFPGAHNVWCENQPVSCGNRAMFTVEQWNSRAAPAEDVRAVVDEQDLFESVFPMPAHTMRFDGGYAATEFNAWSAHDFVQKWDGWKARARLNPQ